LQKLRYRWRLLAKPFSEIRNALAFRNDEKGTELRNRIDAAITTLKETTWRNFLIKWFGTESRSRRVISCAMDVETCGLSPRSFEDMFRSRFSCVDWDFSL